MTNIDPINAALDALDPQGVKYILISAAMVLHGSAYLTQDVDFCYSRDPANTERLARALGALNPRLRVAGVPEGMPVRFDAHFIRNSMNFTLHTDIGDIDLLGHVDGLGGYAEVAKYSSTYQVGSRNIPMLTLEGLIMAKRAVGRTKDLLVLPELEAMREAEMKRNALERRDLDT